VTKLFQTDIASEANLKVFVTDIRSEAELIVYETTDQWLATESPIWCYTDIQSDADKIVYFTQAQWDADLVVYKTDVQSDAGWVDRVIMSRFDSERQEVRHEPGRCRAGTFSPALKDLAGGRDS